MEFAEAVPIGFYAAVNFTEKVQNMKSVQNYTGFMFCTFAKILNFSSVN